MRPCRSSCRRCSRICIRSNDARPGERPRSLKPVIDRTFALAFDDIVHAHRYGEAGAQAGKIVVAV
ncbi:zinc-binding dehydrogenase [Burkholderia cepacia]|nr:zinc-binding dehydrogenase [Burkholderia cepacia]MBY4736312.1 zinc-binding dehydrogenase [Burkholderia cepacia]MBY4745607.1 zinc-binding dehydrogenase [Burkholderia cepacia]MBY4760270.1 zinc-binding dehydrogenase [Burkholderia cepacia]MBY4777186.1 zinc-binding dehydrogenase [Burkholderia cepacia]